MYCLMQTHNMITVFTTVSFYSHLWGESFFDIPGRLHDMEAQISNFHEEEMKIDLNDMLCSVYPQNSVCLWLFLTTVMSTCIQQLALV